MRVTAKPTTTTTPPTKRVLRLPDVIERSGLPRSTIYWLMKQGRFPASIKLSERAIGWRESDVDAWLARRAALGNGEEAA